MKVLLVHPPMPFRGGAEVVLERLRGYLPVQGHRVKWLTSRRPRGRVRDLITLWREVQDELHERYDLINVHNFPATVAAWPACRRIPTVWMCNEPAELFTSWVRRPIEAFNRGLVQRHIRDVVVADRANQARFQSLYGVEPRVIPYGVDGEFFAVNPGVEKRPEFTMLQVGTITPYKNQLESVRLLARLVRDIPDARLILAGTADNGYLREIQAYLRGRNLWGRVEVTGHVDPEETRRLFHSCHVLLHPVKQQGGWLTPFEAVAAGMPIVVSRLFTAAGLIEDEGLGATVDPFEYARRHVLAIHRGDVGENGAASEYVRRELTWDKFCGRMVDYFEEVLGR